MYVCILCVCSMFIWVYGRGRIERREEKIIVVCQERAGHDLRRPRGFYILSVLVSHHFISIHICLMHFLYFFLYVFCVYIRDWVCRFVGEHNGCQFFNVNYEQMIVQFISLMLGHLDIFILRLGIFIWDLGSFYWARFVVNWVIGFYCLFRSLSRKICVRFLLSSNTRFRCT